VTPNSLPGRQAGELGTLNSLSGLPEFISESNNRLRLRVNSAENSFLVLSDTYFPGWKAYVDSKREKIYQANYAFRAIPLTAGRHEVEFVYDPLSFKLGTAVTLLGITGCIGIIWVTKRRGAKENKKECEA